MHKLFVKIIGLTTLLGFIFSTPTHTHASSSTTLPQVIIINQVRGQECCHPGSLDHLKNQIKTHQQLGIPAYFVLRYDALQDSSYVNLIKKAQKDSPEIIRVGALIEIIPSLATDTNLEYQAGPDNWQEAQHVFTIGYSKEEREKIITQIMSSFYQQFNQYPLLTNAWMIDTPSLNYLSDKYQVKAHLITREQWATDTYNLHGGPPHYPYPASSNWLFNLDYQSQNRPLILRQTLTDPLLNYGDTNGFFTSQPNDYLTGNQDFSYFQKLLDQALFSQETTTGFALLGLENSMEEKYQQEFAKQLSYIQSLYQQGKISYPTIQELNHAWSKTPLTTYQGKNLTQQDNNQVVWITTPRYRVRLRLSNQTLAITDFRIFDPYITDPYTDYQAIKEGYWITPYFIDGSLNQTFTPPKRSLWLKIFGPPPPPPSLTKPQSDLSLNTTHLELPHPQPNQSLNLTKPSSDKVILTYQSTDNQTVTLNFNLQNITLTPASKNSIVYQNHNSKENPIKFKQSNQGFSLTWPIDQKTSHQLDTNCQNNRCLITPTIDPQLTNLLRQEHYPFIFPERAPKPIDKDQTTLYVHNRYAVANRNPSRLILIPRDKFGLPIVSQNKISISTTPSVDITNTQSDQNISFDQIIDLHSNQPTKTTLEVKTQNKILKKETVFFAPNCKQNPIYCLTHPLQTTWYLKAIIHDRIRSNIFGEQQ